MTLDASHSIRRRFAERLRVARRSRGFRTAKSFAQRLGIDQNTYTRYERGEAEPSIAMLERIWITLQLPASDLFGGSGVLARDATDGIAPSQGGERTATPVTLRETLAWRLAEAFVDAIPAAALSQPGRSRLQRKGRLFLELHTNPYPTLARLLAEFPEGSGPEPMLARLDQAARAFTTLLDEETARRKARS
jgi:transcriptional regulator with XRE-family HTH domain